MLVQCPNCKHLFDLPEASFSASKFRCSSCKTIWENDHKLSIDSSDSHKTSADWILLWSVLGLIIVALYADFPRVSLFFSNVKQDLYSGNENAFKLNKLAEEEDDRRGPAPLVSKDEVPQSFNMTEETDDPNA